MNQSPFQSDQQQQDSPQEAFPSNYNFGQGDFTFGTPAQPKKSNTARNCLIIGGVVFACIAICCLCVGAVMYNARETVPPLMWTQLTQQDMLDNASELNVVCEGSQAESFTRDFVESYPGTVEFSIDDETIIDEDANQVTIKGTMQHAGEVLPYEAVFTINPDDKFFLIFGCISHINQISPPLP